MLVAFEHGDPSLPFVIGGLWNGTDTPPFERLDCSTPGKVKHSRVRLAEPATSSVFFDDPGKSGIALISSDNGSCGSRSTRPERQV